MRIFSKTLLSEFTDVEFFKLEHLGKLDELF